MGKTVVPPPQSESTDLTSNMDIVRDVLWEWTEYIDGLRNGRDIVEHLVFMSKSRLAARWYRGNRANKGKNPF